MEISIVMAVLGLLVAIGQPAYQRWRGRAVQAQAKQELAILYTAQRSFKEDYKTFHWHLPATGFVPEWISRANSFPPETNGKRFFGISIPVNGTVATLAALGLSSPGGYTYSSGTGYLANATYCPAANSALGPIEVSGFGASLGDVTSSTFRAIALGCPMGRVPLGSPSQLDRWSINQDQFIQHHNAQP